MCSVGNSIDDRQKSNLEAKLEGMLQKKVGKRLCFSVYQKPEVKKRRKEVAKVGAGTKSDGGSVRDLFAFQCRGKHVLTQNGRFLWVQKPQGGLVGYASSWAGTAASLVMRYLLK